MIGGDIDLRKSNQLVQEVLRLFMWRKMEESLENCLRHEGHRPSNEGGGMADEKVTQDNPEPCVGSWHGTWDSTFSSMPLSQSLSGPLYPKLSTCF